MMILSYDLLSDISVLLLVMLILLHFFPFSVAVSLDYVIHAYFCGLTADVLYDFATALEVISPLCPQFYFLLPFFLLLMLTAVFDS